MNDNEKITIIMAVHNGTSNLEKAIESLLKQDRKPNQIIIGDNDSTDNTYKTLCDLLEADVITIENREGLPPKFDGILNDVPIKIFRKRFSTHAHTLNVCLNMSPRDTTIFGFLDQNSWYELNKLSKVIECFQIDNAIGCVVNDYYLHRKDNIIQRVYCQSFDFIRLVDQYQYDKNFSIKSVVFNKLGRGFNNQLSEREDYEFLLEMSKIGLIYHIPEPLHHNIQHDLNNELESTEQVIRQRYVKT